MEFPILLHLQHLVLSILPRSTVMIWSMVEKVTGISQLRMSSIFSMTIKWLSEASPRTTIGRVWRATPPPHGVRVSPIACRPTTVASTTTSMFVVSGRSRTMTVGLFGHLFYSCLFHHSREGLRPKGLIPLWYENLESEGRARSRAKKLTGWRERGNSRDDGERNLSLVIPAKVFDWKEWYPCGTGISWSSW